MKHCLILDIGKTNKKAFVFDEDYRIVFENSVQLAETIDEDGEVCEDIKLLEKWVVETTALLLCDPQFQIAAINCAAYGASFVYLNAHFRPLTPLYNYLKPIPADVLDVFLGQYGPPEKISLETASPLLGHLNSGLQLFGIKQRNSLIFNTIEHALHLPNWVAFLMQSKFQTGISHQPVSEMTSIGCHTMLWNFQKNDYHEWVQLEGIAVKFPEIIRSRKSDLPTNSGMGLHDSSAALIPYLATFNEPFVLLSTGTWCISMNPFNDEPLTAAELAQDCLCYLTHEGKPIKSARYFGGHEYAESVKKLAKLHEVPVDFFTEIDFTQAYPATGNLQKASEAYLAFMRKMVQNQVTSTRFAIGNSAVKHIYVDGGFSKNTLFMQFLAEKFPEMKVFAAEVAQATALGAALAIHGTWNGKAVPKKLVKTQTVS